MRDLEPSAVTAGPQAFLCELLLVPLNQGMCTQQALTLNSLQQLENLRGEFPLSESEAPLTSLAVSGLETLMGSNHQETWAQGLSRSPAPMFAAPDYFPCLPSKVRPASWISTRQASHSCPAHPGDSELKSEPCLVRPRVSQFPSQSIV